MDREKAFSFTAGCYSGEPASCTCACPFHLDLRSLMKKAAKGRWSPAYKELRTAVLFPAITAELCPRYCEAVCQRETVLGDGPIAVGLLEKACIAYTKKREAPAWALPPKTQSVAVVGAGPAGLSCAVLLAQKKYLVTVFDQNEGWGGALRAHPAFAAFEEDFASSFKAAPAEFRFGHRVAALDELARFDAIVLATGQDGDGFNLLDGWDPALFSTSDPHVYLCGEVTGAELVEGMAQAMAAARSVESFIESGSTSFAAAQEGWDKEKCTRWVPHPGAGHQPRVLPAGDEYTEEEALAEAGRCLLCDCEACMEACELLIQTKRKPPRINSDVFMDGGGRNSVSSACITRPTWSCNLCGRCGRQCHTGADLRGLFQYSRADRVAGGNFPPALHDYWLREMEFAAGEAGYAAAGPKSEYAFFPGCALGASGPAWVEKSYAFLHEKLGAGLILNCCGAPAWWAGDNTGFESHIAALRGSWEALGGPRLVTACATCERMLADFLPEVPLVSLYEILAEDPPAEGASFLERAAVFDPCAAADDTGAKQAVRALAAAGGLKLSDFGSDGRCCGFGGHMQLANPGLYHEITQNRVEASEDPFLVWCANCRDVFASRGKDCAHVLDVAFGLEPGALPTLEEKRANSLRVKRNLMKQYWNEEFTPETHPWDSLRVSVPPAVTDKMERGLITLGDARETIFRAREAGEGFRNADGEILCSLTRPYVTYWVLYKMEDAPGAGEEIQVVDAYSHRMRVRGKPHGEE